MKISFTTDKYESLSHIKWDCKYHVVFIPKRRRRLLYGQLRKYLEEVFRELARQKESRVEKGHLMPDHLHMMLSIPPKYAMLQVAGYIKGKRAIHLARVYGERKRNFVEQHFWARGYFVWTVGRDETMIREYIRNQEAEDERLEQMKLWQRAWPPIRWINRSGVALAPGSPCPAAHLEQPIGPVQASSRLIPKWNVEPTSRLTSGWKRLLLARQQCGKMRFM